jgi:pantothenate kinase-related protein Tda10
VTPPGPGDGGPAGKTALACDDIVREIERWSRDAADRAALPFLLSGRTQTVVCALRAAQDERFEEISALTRIAIDRHLAPRLLRIAAGAPGDTAVEEELITATCADPVPSVFSPAAAISAAGVTQAARPAGTVVARSIGRERVRLLKSLWEGFARWWFSYFPDADDVSAPIVDLWRLYIPFAQWITGEKRRRRPGELFMVGFNGSPGAGKTVLSNALAVVLNRLLDQEDEGQAIARSGDDWYLGKSERERLRRSGYDPGAGVSNRSLPGTHDLAWLRRNLGEMERSTAGSVIMMGNFDKKADDQPSGADRYYEVRGRVGVFLFDLWFAGAQTDVDPLRLPDGLQRKVAESLCEWRTVFDRIDALWAFDWPSLEQMLREREAQERLVERRRGARGMSREHVRAFMSYMVEQSWDWRTTSPVPPDEAISFRAWRDTAHRLIAVQRGGRA